VAGVAAASAVEERGWRSSSISLHLGGEGRL